MEKGRERSSGICDCERANKYPNSNCKDTTEVEKILRI
jgi:hypothetical protein